MPDSAQAFVMAAGSDATGSTFSITAPPIVNIKAENVAGTFGTEIEYGDLRPGYVGWALVSAERARDMPGLEGRDCLRRPRQAHRLCRP